MLSSFTNVTGIAIFLGLLFISIALHETMHALTAHRLGDDLAHSRGRISLNPLRHIDPLLTLVLPAFMLLIGTTPILAAKPVPINSNRISGDEMGLAAVGIAGPLTNLVLATVAAFLLKFGGLDVGLLYDIVRFFVELNVALFVFNMLPIPPLDGSRLLYAFAPSGVQRVMEQIEQMGVMIVIAFLFLLLPVISPVLEQANDFILNILL